MQTSTHNLLLSGLLYSRYSRKGILILWLEIVSVHKMTVLYVHYNLKINFFPRFLVLINLFIQGKVIVIIMKTFKCLFSIFCNMGSIYRLEVYSITLLLLIRNVLITYTCLYCISHQLNLYQWNYVFSNTIHFHHQIVCVFYAIKIFVFFFFCHASLHFPSHQFCPV